ncbi:MAG: RNA 2',3'-cyclic phosphodiesterase [Kiloniellales bacterium]
MIRLFVAIPLPEDLRQRLGGLCAGVPGAKWVRPENLHLSLRFIGEVEETLMDDIDGALGRIRSPAFEVTFREVGRFETGRQPRVLWVGIERCPPLERLHDKIEAAITGQGLDPEPRKFKPHVTLARLKNSSPARVGAYLSVHGLFRHGPVPVECFTLFSSRLGKSGAVYRAEAEYPLDPAPPAQGFLPAP